jgi:hypothetical protein
MRLEAGSANSFARFNSIFSRRFQLIDGGDFIRLTAQVGQCLLLRGMPKRFHQQRNRRLPLHSLPVAPGLSQGMAAIIALQAHVLAPGFHPRTHRFDRQAPPLSREEVILHLQVPDR